jgi:hypothetical protein
MDTDTSETYTYLGFALSTYFFAHKVQCDTDDVRKLASNVYSFMIDIGRITLNQRIGVFNILQDGTTQLVRVIHESSDIVPRVLEPMSCTLTRLLTNQDDPTKSYMFNITQNNGSCTSHDIETYTYAHDYIKLLLANLQISAESEHCEWSTKPLS